MKWMAAAALLAAVTSGCGVEQDGHGRDLTCPDGQSSVFPDQEEGDPGAGTADLAAAPFLDPLDRIVSDIDQETVTFRSYDTGRHLLAVVRVVQLEGTWYADRVDACD